MQGGHSPREPEKHMKVREFKSGQGKVREKGKVIHAKSSGHVWNVAEKSG